MPETDKFDYSRDLLQRLDVMVCIEVMLPVTER